MSITTPADRSVTTGHICDLAWVAAYDLAWTLPQPLGTETVPTAAGPGRVLAAPIRATSACPAFDVAAMDGYAVVGDGPWQILGRVRAGGPAWPAILSTGQAVEIATGGVVPNGTDAVIRYEDADSDGDRVIAPRPTRTHIRRAGDDAAAGDVLVAAGRTINGAVLGAAAQAGVDELSVFHRPRIRLLVTGDEVIAAGVPTAGQVRDAISPIVTALAARAGSVIVDHRHLPDDAPALAEAIHSDGDIEVIVVTGSSSVGVHDHLHRGLTGGNATWHVDGVRCRPGHPQILARTADGAWLVGLPGNPYAGLAAALTLLEPVLVVLGGGHRPAGRRVSVTGEARPARDTTRLVPVRLRTDRAEIIAGARPAGLAAIAAADAVAVLEPTWEPDATALLLSVP